MTQTNNNAAKTITREELANVIQQALVAEEGLGGKVWIGGNNIRVYVMIDKGGKRGWIPNGQISINSDGSVAIDKHSIPYEFGRVRSVAEAAIAGRIAEPVKTYAAPHAASVIDEDESQHIESDRRTAASESAREIG